MNEYPAHVVTMACVPPSNPCTGDTPGCGRDDASSCPLPACSSEEGEGQSVRVGGRDNGVMAHGLGEATRSAESLGRSMRVGLKVLGRSNCYAAQ